MGGQVARTVGHRLAPVVRLGTRSASAVRSSSGSSKLVVAVVDGERHAAHHLVARLRPGLVPAQPHLNALLASRRSGRSTRRSPWAAGRRAVPPLARRPRPGARPPRCRAGCCRATRWRRAARTGRGRAAPRPWHQRTTAGRSSGRSTTSTPTSEKPSGTSSTSWVSSSPRPAPTSTMVKLDGPAELVVAPRSPAVPRLARTTARRRRTCGSGQPGRRRCGRSRQGRTARSASLVAMVASGGTSRRRHYAWLTATGPPEIPPVDEIGGWGQRDQLALDGGWMGQNRRAARERGR